MQIHARANDPFWAKHRSFSATTSCAACAQVFPLCWSGANLDLPGRRAPFMAGLVRTATTPIRTLPTLSRSST